MKYELSKPIKVGDKEIKVIEYDLLSLSARDFSAVKKDWSRAGNMSISPALDFDFCLMLVAKCLHIPSEDLYDMAGVDSMGITQQVSNFLLQSGLQKAM